MQRARLPRLVVAVVVACGMTACSTSTPPRRRPPPVPQPGESACAVQGYFDEQDGGTCPAGTCLVDEVDTNGGAIPCCTSITSGPGHCLGDAGVAEAGPDATPDASDASDAGDAGDASEASDSSDASDAADAGDGAGGDADGDAGDGAAE